MNYKGQKLSNIEQKGEKQSTLTTIPLSVAEGMTGKLFTCQPASAPINPPINHGVVYAR